MKICVVDDLISMRKALKRVLSELPGSEVHTCATVPETLAFVDSHYVDVIVSDIYLQKGSGFDILRHIRGRSVGADVPVIFVTGEGTKDDIVHASDLGVNDYVLKPFDAADLLAKVSAAVKKVHNPSRVDRMIRRAEEFLFSGQFEEARDCYLATKHQDKFKPRATVGLARTEILMGEKKLAMQRLRRVIEEHPMFYSAYNQLVDLLLDLGRSKEAFEYLKQEVDINGKQPKRRMLLADLLLEFGEAEEALAQLRQAIVDLPMDESLLLKMATVFESLGDHEKAIHYFMKTRRMVRGSKLALKGILDLCMKSGQTKRGYQILTDLINADKTLKDGYLYRALLFEFQEDYESALADLDVYLLSCEEDLEALFLKAKLLGRLKLYLEQARTFLEIHRLQPSTEWVAKAGLGFLKADEFEQAAKNYETAIKLDPSSLKYRFNLAYAYERMGSIDKAIAMFQTVLKLDPANSDAAHAIDRLTD